MSKVIVERPRRLLVKRAGSWYPRGRLKMRWFPDLEDAPMREGMAHTYRDKWLNENLQPLVRFLRSNVGRPWDDVYSEVAKHVRCTSAVQKHVIDHLRDYVEEHPIMIDGVAHHPNSFMRGWNRRIESTGMRFRFYVCPRSRVLCAGPIAARKKRHGPPPDPNVRVLSPTRELRCIRGVWFDVELGERDGDPRAVVRKVQLGSKEIARRSLRG